MEGRISTFASKCDQAINNIRKLKTHSRTFVAKLNCEPSELKEQFLTCMNKLDEYIYLMTDFNLSIDNLEKKDSMELAPVHDNSYQNYPVMTPTNLMDVLSEPAQMARTAACPNMCPAEKPHTKRRPKAEQPLIAFSSTSCSAESVPETNVKCVAEDMGDLTVKDPDGIVKLPAQTTLEVDKQYEATIMSIDGTNFWVAIQDANDAYDDLFSDMLDYYEREENRVEYPLQDIPNFTCCVYHDSDETGGFYRAVFVNATEEMPDGQEVFLVDTGEFRAARPGRLQPMAARFGVMPPYARCSHLADVEVLSSKGKELEEYLKQFLGNTYTMKVDDNSSESLAVYLFFDEEITLNELLVQEGLATALERPLPETSGPREPVRGPPELLCSDSEERLQRELDRAAPEHDDPVEAVTGYNFRDEMDLCRHYKGGPDKTCFKGARCKKRHELKHPDGWTRDRVPVSGKCRSLPLPAPGTWHKVAVTYVCHFDRLYVQFTQDTVKDELPGFGIVLPPMTLASLVRDMNSPATYANFKPLQLAPAPGELVAAKYVDGQWYRARVICSTRADQCVELIYIDYGNVVSVKENEIMELDARFTLLPAQAVLCRLAGVAKLDDCSKRWAAAKTRLARLAQDRAMEAQIIARNYDEITVEMFDSEGYNLAEQLAAGGDVAFDPDYQVEDDSRRRFQHVLP